MVTWYEKQGIVLGLIQTCVAQIVRVPNKVERYCPHEQFYTGEEKDKQCVKSKQVAFHTKREEQSSLFV